MSKLLTAIAFVLLFAGHLGGASLLEDVIEKTLPLSSGQGLALNGIDGAVEVYGSSRADIKITAIRRAFSPARLNAIEIRTEQTPAGINISTSLPEAKAWRDHSGTVEYLVEVPQNIARMELQMRDGELIADGLRGGMVAASLRDGRITMRNCFCDQRVRAQGGGIDLVYNWEEDRTVTVDARIERGNIFALFPGEVSFRFRAEAPRGKVSSDFTAVKDRQPGGVSLLEEVVGQAPNSSLTLHAIEGNIRIAQLIW